MADATLSPAPSHRRYAVVTDDLLLEALDILTGWAYRPDEYDLCAVPGCLVRSTRLDAGMCPRALWDERHELFAAIPDWMRR